MQLSAVGTTSGPHIPIQLEGVDPITHVPYRLSTWLFSFSEDEIQFNAERLNLHQGMRLTVISPSNQRIDGIVQSLRPYSLSCQRVSLEIDKTRNHRPPIDKIFSK